MGPAKRQSLRPLLYSLLYIKYVVISNVRRENQPGCRLHVNPSDGCEMMPKFLVESAAPRLDSSCCALRLSVLLLLKMLPGTCL